MKKALLALCLLAMVSIVGLNAKQPPGPITLTRPDTPYFKAITESADIAAGETYYLRSCIWISNNTYSSLNNRTEELVPINTLVTVKGMDTNSTLIVINETGARITIKNAVKFSGCEIPTLCKQLLSKTPIALEKYDAQIASAIRSGKVIIGMNKEHVAMARGLPLGVRNPNLNKDQWTYTNSSRSNMKVEFKDGITTRIKDDDAGKNAE